NQRHGDQQGDLDVLDGGADGQGAVGDDVHLDRLRDVGLDPRHRLLDGLDRADHVGAGRLVDRHVHDATGFQGRVLVGGAGFGPGAGLVVLDVGDRAADVLDPHGGAALVGDDQVVPGGRVE